MKQQQDDAVSAVIGVILMVAITVALAATVVYLVADMGSNVDRAPTVAFQADGAEALVIDAPGDLDWSDLDVQGCDAPTGEVKAGDRLTSCTGRVVVRHVESNQLVWSHDFG